LGGEGKIRARLRARLKTGIDFTRLTERRRNDCGL